MARKHPNLSKRAEALDRYIDALRTFVTTHARAPNRAKRAMLARQVGYESN
jgi:hypothetical protein